MAKPFLYLLATCAGLLAATSLTAWAAIIPMYVFAGQSNAVGVNHFSELTPAQAAPQPNVLFYGPNELGNTWAPLTASPTSPNSFDGFGPEISAGKTISAGLGGMTVAEVKFAVGATSLYDLADWNPAGTNNLYDQMVDRVNGAANALVAQGHTTFVAGFFWMQGESDADEGRASEYAANLTNLIASVRGLYGEPTPFVFGQIIDRNATTAVLRAQQQQVANTVPNTAYVLTDDLGHTDFIHFSGQGAYTIGERFGAAYLAMVPEPGSLAVLVVAAGGGVLVRRCR
jgi:hypothetical protein